MPVHVKPDDAWVKARAVWVRTTTGWKVGRKIHRKTGVSTWNAGESMDTMGPGLPALVSLTTDAATRQVTLRARMPIDADVAGATLKYATGTWPPTERDSAYIYSGDNHTPRKVATAGQEITWTFNVKNYGTQYWISVWAVDSSGNPSDRLRRDITILAPKSAPAPVDKPPVVSKITYNAVSSASYDWVRSFWNVAYYGTTAVQGGDGKYAGGWFYGTKISSALAQKTKINKFTIRIQRASSAHGVSTGANVWLVPHRLTGPGQSKAETPKLVVAGPAINVGTLTRGQAKVFNVPTAWWPHFLSGAYKGFAIHYEAGPTAWTSANYLLSYGAGTTSGQVYIEAQ